MAPLLLCSAETGKPAPFPPKKITLYRGALPIFLLHAVERQKLPATPHNLPAPHSLHKPVLARLKINI